MAGLRTSDEAAHPRAVKFSLRLPLGELSLAAKDGLVGAAMYRERQKHLINIRSPV